MWEFIQQYKNGQWETIPQWNERKADKYLQNLIPKPEPEMKTITPEEHEEVNKIIKRMKEEGLLPKLEE